MFYSYVGGGPEFLVRVLAEEIAKSVLGSGGGGAMVDGKGTVL